MELGAPTPQRDLVVVPLSSKWADKHQLPFVAGMKTVMRYEDLQRVLEVTSNCPQLIQDLMRSVESRTALYYASESSDEMSCCLYPEGLSALTKRHLIVDLIGHRLSIYKSGSFMGPGHIATSGR